MAGTDLQVLKSSIDEVVSIICRNGESMLARVHAVREEDGDLVYDLVSTTKGHNARRTISLSPNGSP